MEIRKADGEPFGNKGSLAIALKNQGIENTYEAIEKDGGFIGVPIVATKKLTKCRVHRSNVDPDNKDMVISLTVNSISNKKTFWPGEEVELTQSQISVLKDSVEEVRIEIPPESGIYSSKDPVSVAKAQNPGFSAEIDRATGLITLVQRVPNYIIEVV